MRDKMRYIPIIVIIILLLTTLSGCIEINSNEEKEMITARDGLNLANETVSENYDEPVLETIRGFGSISNNGKATGWIYSYLVEKSDVEYMGLEIKIYADNKTDVIEFGGVNKSTRYPTPLLNWTLDSHEIMNIARENQKINNYLNKYKNIHPEVMQLDMWSTYSNDDAVWIINWLDMGSIFDDPAGAEIVINANTGEVLYVDADI